MTSDYYVSPGELRVDLLQVFEEADPIRFLLAHPGLLPTPFHGLATLARRPTAAADMRTMHSFRRASLEHLANELDRLPQSREWEARVRSWISRLRDGRATFSQHMGTPLFSRLISRRDDSVLFQGPMTVETTRLKPGGELHATLTGQEHTRAREWFEERLKQAEDITADVRAVLESSWAGEILNPEDMYYKIVAEYFRSTLESMDRQLDRNPLLEVMTDFQADAYHYAKGILRRFGGVMLSDVVGLGKTFIGVALLRHLQERYDQHAVVVAPPAVCAAWKELADTFKVTLVTVSHGKLDELDQYDDREILLLDESHNFRNSETARFERLGQWLRPGGAPATRRVILVSATPQNNDPKDVLNQLRLFPDNHSRLPYPGESLDTFFDSVRRKSASLTTLLQHVVVRRTRRFIKESYPNAKVRVPKTGGGHEWKPLVFPKRISGEEQCLRYSLDDTYKSGLYDRLIDMIANLSYAIYAPAEYILDEYLGDERIVALRRTGRALRGLMKVLLLKRLESSTTAITVTLERLKNRHLEAIQRLGRGLVQVRAAPRSRSTADDSESSNLDEGENLPIHMFDHVNLRRNLESDMSLLVTAKREMGGLKASMDGKLIRLEAALSARPPAAHRTVIFTQFADTAIYLRDQLGTRFGRMELVTGSSGNARSTVLRFAPRANRATVAAGDEIDLLITTDALSEGVNLQDADTLINYDLHWNPVRLIQRAGRIDRIGSSNEVIVVASFLPERALEARLGLEEVLRKRIAEFIKVFGEDSTILPSDEALVEEDVVSAYTGAALNADEQVDDLDGLGRHSERILALRRSNPERFDRLLRMRMARRSISAGSVRGVAATRLGWFWNFWKQRPSGVELIDDLEGLELFWSHAGSGVGVPSSETASDRLSSSLERLGSQSREAFQATAHVLRSQRLQPRLSAQEQWVADRLDAYAKSCNEARRELAEELIAWVQSGQQKQRVIKAARSWKLEGLMPETVFTEVRALASAFPLVMDELDEEELVGLVVGTGEHAPTLLR